MSARPKQWSPIHISQPGRLLPSGPVRSRFTKTGGAVGDLGITSCEGGVTVSGILAAGSGVCSAGGDAGLDGEVLGLDFFEGFLTTDCATVFFTRPALLADFVLAVCFFVVEVLTDFSAVVFTDFLPGFFLVAVVGFVD